MPAPATTTADQTSSRSVARSADHAASRKTVLIALAANSVIAVAKLAGGLASGSSALLAEAAHSLADSTNNALREAVPDVTEVFLDPTPSRGR